MADDKNDKNNQHNWKLYLVLGLVAVMFLPTNGCGGKKTNPKPPAQTQQTQQQQPKPEPPKQEAAKPETPKQEAPKPEPPPPPKEESPKEKATARIKSKVREYVGTYYANTNIDSITVNDDLGTDKENDYVVLLNLTWNVKNSGTTSKEMLDMYSSDMAARMYQDLPEVQELCIFWTVPYLNGKAKISFERKNGGMAYTDTMFDRNFNK